MKPTMNRPALPRHGADARPYSGATYYGTPALKPTPWDWKVPLYMAIGGAAGGAQVIGTLARVAGGPGAASVVRTGRYVGLAASLAGAPLLIYDLKTPRRWYNMVRIFRPTSPMSIGSYVLTGFGAFSGAAALGEALKGETGLPRVAGIMADLAQGPAAVAGAFMTTYTATLLSATSTPLWASAPEALAVRFGASAAASGAAVLSLGEHLAGSPENARRLDRLGLLAAALGLAASFETKRQFARAGVAGPLEGGDGSGLHTASRLVGYGVPIACHAVNLALKRPVPALSIAASLAALAGSWMMRSALVRLGNDSAKRPRDSLRFTQSDRLPPSERPRPLPQALRRRVLEEAP